MSTITKELLHQTISELEEERDAVPGVVNEDAARALAAMKITLASLEAKPIGAFHIANQQVDGTSDYIKDGEWPIDDGVIEVYAATPVPVSEMEPAHKFGIGSVFKPQILSVDEVDCDNCAHYQPNVCHGEGFPAAMLQGAEHVSNCDEFPLDYLQGLKDGLEWAAQLAEANHPHTGDWLYDDPLELAKAIRKGPDMPTESVQGWIPCSEWMPEESGRYWCYVEEQNDLGKSHYQWNCSWNGDRWWVESENGGRVTHWQPLPSPPDK